MFRIWLALLWCETIEQGCDALPGYFDSWLGGPSEQRFQLGETSIDLSSELLGRQEEKPRAHGANGPAHRRALVAAEIGHDDNLAGLERRHEELLDIGVLKLSLLIGPSRTQGASIRSCRKVAMGCRCKLGDRNPLGYLTKPPVVTAKPTNIAV